MLPLRVFSAFKESHPSCRSPTWSSARSCATICPTSGPATSSRCTCAWSRGAGRGSRSSRASSCAARAAASGRRSPSARSPSASASSGPSRSTRPASPRSSWSPGATSAGPSSTTCASGPAGPRRSRRSAAPPGREPGRPFLLSKTSDERGQLGDPTGPPPPPAAVEPPPYHKEDEKQPGMLAVLRETVVLVALAVLLAVVFKTFLVAAFYIPSGSMEPTLNISDRVLVEKVSYRFGDIEHGDVVVFVHEEPGSAVPGPSNPIAGFFSSLGQAIGVVPPSDRDFIKRVVGLPGDTINCRNGGLYRNGERVPEPYLNPGTETQSCTQTTVGPGELYVMGDNRSNSQDSRVFGPIKRSDVVGRAFVRIWPLTDIGWL